MSQENKSESTEGVFENKMANEKALEAVVIENLKSLKVLHQLLVVLSAILLAFALRPDPSEDYNRALAELSTLKQVSFDGWGAFVKNRYTATEDRDNAFVRSVVRLAGLSFEGHPKLDQPVYAEPPPYIGNAKLIEFDSFLTRTTKIGAIRLDADKKYIADQLKQAAGTRHGHPLVSQVWLQGFPNLVPQVNGARIIDWRNTAPTGITSLSFIISDQPQTIPNQPINIIASYAIDSESGSFTREWLKTDTFGQKLIDPMTGDIFPNLKKFWEKLNGLTADQATVFVQELLEATSRGTLSFLGIPVERSLAISAGPAFCLVILLALCLHIRHCCAIPAEGGMFTEYPWAVLFRGFWGHFVIFVTVLGLPISSTSCLLIKFSHKGEWSSIVGAVLVFLIIVVAVWTVIEIYRLRHEWFSKRNTAEPTKLDVSDKEGAPST
jgi:hypothetical protein